MIHLMFVSLVLICLGTQFFALLAQTLKPTSHITIVGVVYCDTCYENTFSRQSYFLPGAEVHVQCRFKANSPKTTEEIAFSVNRTTNRYGVYKLDIPTVEGVDCVESQAIQSFCESTLLNSTISQCNTPSMKTTTNEITVRSKQGSICIYSLGALTFKPPKKNTTLCGKQTKDLNLKMSSNTEKAFNSSKFFLPYFPPYVFPWPQLPPLPKLPFPPCPPIPNFPFPPSPPGFNWGDPRTWIPRIPSFSPPPPPVFNWGDPKSWIPNIPLLTPPPSPTFDLSNPRTWIPYLPPIPPTNADNKP